MLRPWIGFDFIRIIMFCNRIVKWLAPLQSNSLNINHALGIKNKTLICLKQFYQKSTVYFRPLLKLNCGNILKTNVTGKTKPYIQTTEQIAIRLIIKIRHPNNALGTHTNAKNFINPNYNWTILNPLCITRQTRHSRFRFPSCTLLEHFRV